MVQVASNRGSAGDTATTASGSTSQPSLAGNEGRIPFAAGAQKTCQVCSFLPIPASLQSASHEHPNRTDALCFL